jgi:iron complex transport system substrate-binding protein
MVVLVAALLAFASPQRIVSTSPGITETLYALGLGDRVVGVTTYCRYPPEAAKKPKIGTYLQPNIETILSLKPDLVIAETSGVRRASRISSLNLKVLEVDNTTLAGIYESIRRIGAAAGVPAAADALAARIRSNLEDVRKRTAGRRPRVLVIVGRTPGRLEELVAAGKGSHLDELIAIAGGDNIFEDSAAPYAKISMEALLRRNPEVIVDIGELMQTGAGGETALWSRYPALAAVKEHRVFALQNDIFVVPGPRIAEAARALARLFHPEAGL